MNLDIQPIKTVKETAEKFLKLMTEKTLSNLLIWDWIENTDDIDHYRASLGNVVFKLFHYNDEFSITVDNDEAYFSNRVRREYEKGLYDGLVLEVQKQYDKNKEISFERFFEKVSTALEA